MNPDLADDLLREVMGEAVTVDFPDQLGILRSLAMYKYDDYQQYAPGRQFIESLALWLEQFGDADERRSALRFVRSRLIYISDVEMRHLVILLARDRVPAVLRHRVAHQLNLPAHAVVAVETRAEFARAKRTSLFLGMSDGARIDQLRRSSEGLSNEQFAINYELSIQRAKTMVTELKTDQHDEGAAFEHIFLVDDFAGSGRTILRHDEDADPNGRLVRFVQETLPRLMTSTYPKIFITLYLATEQAVQHLRSLISAYPSPPWPKDNAPEVIAVMTLGDHARLRHDPQGAEDVTDQLFDVLLHKYYDTSVEDEHKGEVVHGFSDCGLPLVLSHNTPNNSVYLLWEQERTRALFPRFERHHGRLRED